MMKKIMLSIFKYLGIFLLVIGIFNLCLYLACLIPSSSLEENVRESADILGEQGMDYLISKIFRIVNNNCTDSVIINESYSIDNEHPYISYMKARKNYQKDVTINEIEDIPGEGVTVNYLYEDEAEGIEEGEVVGYYYDPIGELFDFLSGLLTSSLNYARYWHGYLVFLRPLLAIFNYSQIRKINAVMQIVVFLILLLLMIKNKIGIYVISFISCYILMCPVALSMSLQNSTVWYISCISCIIYLLWKEKITKYKLHYLLFTIVGMVTSFMDLLTYPIVSLGMLLLFVLISEELDFKEAVKRILICGICWTLGYGIMWGAKWVIGTLVIGENVIQQALNQASYRSSNLTWGDVEVSRIGVIKNTLQMFHLPMTKKIILFHGICCLSIVLINLKKYHVKEMKKRIMDVLPIYAVGLMTFVWYLVLTNHTQIHPFLAFRTAFVFIFAVTVGTYKLIS